MRDATRPRQSLTVVARLFPEIVDGRKTHTIRWRETPIEPGQLLFVCEGRPELTATVCVTLRTDMRLSEVAVHLGREAEWPDEVLLDGMRAHYPGIDLDSEVSVIEFEPPIRRDGESDGSD